MNHLNNFSKNRSSNLQSGFTLIELIIVIIILAIMSVTVAPKFFSGSGFSEQGYRADAIAKLRLIQTRAMQQRTIDCHEVVIVSKKLGKGVCSGLTFVNPINDVEYRGTVVTILPDDLVEFSPKNTKFTFDSMGRPHTSSGNQAISITVNGEQSLEIRIESEGYIHAN